EGNVRSALRLRVSELQRKISACPPDSPHDRVSRVLSRAQPRRFRSAISIEIDQVGAVDPNGPRAIEVNRPYQNNVRSTNKDPARSAEATRMPRSRST